MKPNKKEAKAGHPLRVIKSNKTNNIELEDLSDYVLKCPKCNSQKIAKSGRTATGKPNFQCKECKRQFVHPLLKDEKNKKSKASVENPEVYCYHCESEKRDFVYRGNDERGRTRFYCNDCKKWFIDPRQRFVHGIVCRRCNSYKCSKCGRELVAVIQEQQQYIKDNLNKDFKYLFCGRRKGATSREHYYPEAKLMSPQSFSIYVNRLAEEENITDSNGKLWRFQSHQFRHTVGTRMINNNVPQHIVQKYLGHESPTMTMRYAHIHDQTLKREIAQFHDSRVVNVAGEVVETSNAELDKNLDLHLFKKNVLAQALSDGSCARPIQLGECPHANACLTCGDFRTTLEFLDQHKTHLEETEKLIKNAEEKGWKRQAEMNIRVRDNLKKIITTLELEDK